MLFADHLTLDAPRKTADGFLTVRARAARVGVYEYSGREIDPQNRHGLRDAAIVKVLRDEDTVFDEKSARSFIGKPVTDDHPSESVNASNWRDHARGTIMGALRDGDYLAFDIMLTDQAVIDKVEAGKRELSNGYTSDLQFGEFKAGDGTICQARQSTIFGNHVAVVDRGRAGSSCAIADAARCDTAPQSFLDSLSKEKPAVKTMLIDGLTVDIANADTAEATIKTLLAARDEARTKLSTAETQVATLTTDKAALETENKQLKDARPTPAQLRDAAKTFAQVADKAKGLGITVTDEMDEGAIMKATVSAKIGDAAKDWSDTQIAASFATLTKDAAPGDAPAQFLRPAIITDNASVRDAARAAQY